MFQTSCDDIKDIAQIFNDHYGFKCIQKTLILNDGHYLACGFQVQGKFISLPLFDFGIVNKISVDAATRLPKVGKNDVIKFVESCNCPAEITLNSITTKATFVLNTDRLFSDFLSSLKSKRRSQLKNIKQKYHFDISVKDDINLEKFYFLYLTKIRDLASIPFKKLFFKDILKMPNSKLVIVTDLAGLVVASSIVIEINNTAHIIWAVSANFNNSNLFMYREVIRHYCDHKNITEFNFGRATINSSQYDFKKKFGARELKIYYSNSDNSNSQKYFYYFLKFSKFFYRALPLIIIERLGGVLMRFFIR